MIPDIHVCYHEAGHAVVGVVLQLPVKCAEITDNYEGYCKIGKIRIPDPKDSIEKYLNHEEVKNRRILFYFAGPAAQAKYEGVPIFDSLVGQDFINAQYAFYYQEPGVKAPQDFLNLINAAWEIVNELEIWNAIIKTSEYLFEFHKISGKDIKKLVRGAIPRSKMQVIRWKYCNSFLI